MTLKVPFLEHLYLRNLFDIAHILLDCRIVQVLSQVPRRPNLKTSHYLWFIEKVSQKSAINHHLLSLRSFSCFYFLVEKKVAI